VLSILGTAKIAVALLVLAVPIIDAFWIIVRRLVQGRSPFSPDRGHLHHRLLDVGLSHRQTVLLIYAICIGLGLLSLLLSGAGQVYAFLGVFVVIGLALFGLSRMDLGGPDKQEPEDLPAGIDGPAPVDIRDIRTAREARDGGQSPGQGSRTG
jgi:UDP-GlcNAc:undecaprenyl-phosphate GlcNAc-1-phosphate transferase